MKHINYFFKKFKIAEVFIITLVVLAGSLFVQTESSFAQEKATFQPLSGQGIEGLTDSETTESLGSLLSSLYELMISIAAVLAVVMIFYAGFKYTISSSESGKTDAKNRIIAALGGLALALSSWLLLSTINPELVNVDLEFQDVEYKELVQEILTDQGRETINDEHGGVVQATSDGVGGTGSVQMINNGSVSSSQITLPNGESLSAVPASSSGNSIDYSDPVGGGAVPLIDTRNKKSLLVSTNFTVDDYDSRYSGPLARISPQLVAGVQRLRDTVGRPLSFGSAYRPLAENRRRGGVDDSQHIAGRAVDIGIPSGMNRDAFLRSIISVFGCNVGLGRGSNFIHVDLRGRHGSWVYSGSSADADQFKQWLVTACRG